MIGIIIPFYQQTAGLLRRALQSVLDQRGPSDCRIYVVDDGSPAPAEAEIAAFPESFAQNILVLRQKNAGPAAARNLALDCLDAHITTVAFLDSDDAWQPDHLANIRTAFSRGAEFYFSDHRREEDRESRFAQCAFRPDGPRLSTAANEPIRWCGSQTLFRAVVLRSPVGTSTVAVRRARIGTKRFPAGFRSAGEDSIFWLALLAGDPLVACGEDNEVAYGRGVSIFNHRSWGDTRALKTILDQMRAHRYLRKHCPLDTSLRSTGAEQCRDLDLAFCTALLACGRRLQYAAAGPAARYLGTRPLALMQLPKALFRAVGRQREQRMP
jgi:succinoglycan biosynthesis protein ExoW